MSGANSRGPIYEDISPDTEGQQQLLQDERDYWGNRGFRTANNEFRQHPVHGLGRGEDLPIEMDVIPAAGMGVRKTAFADIIIEQIADWAVMPRRMQNPYMAELIFPFGFSMGAKESRRYNTGLRFDMPEDLMAVVYSDPGAFQRQVPVTETLHFVAASPRSGLCLEMTNPHNRRFLAGADQQMAMIVFQRLQAFHISDAYPAGLSHTEAHRRAPDYTTGVEMFPVRHPWGFNFPDEGNFEVPRQYRVTTPAQEVAPTPNNAARVIQREQPSKVKEPRISLSLVKKENVAPTLGQWFDTTYVPVMTGLNEDEKNDLRKNLLGQDQALIDGRVVGVDLVKVEPQKFEQLIGKVQTPLLPSNKVLMETEEKPSTSGFKNLVGSVIKEKAEEIEKKIKQIEKEINEDPLHMFDGEDEWEDIFSVIDKDMQSQGILPFREDELLTVPNNSPNPALQNGHGEELNTPVNVVNEEEEQQIIFIQDPWIPQGEEPPFNLIGWINGEEQHIVVDEEGNVIYSLSTRAPEQG